jgi:two-component system, chemotaxis family, sensor kinase CheA
MGFIERMEKNILKLEKRIQKEEMGIARLAEKCESKKITKADFTLKKRVIEERMNGMKSRMRVLQGGIVREKQHQEEKAEEKEKKKEEKEKKKEGKAREKENKSSEEE